MSFRFTTLIMNQFLKLESGVLKLKELKLMFQPLVLLLVNTFHLEATLLDLVMVQVLLVLT